MPRSIGLALVVIGGILVVLGFLVWAGWLSWFGRLPGDVQVERPGLRVYFPITSLVIVSVVLSILFGFFRRLW